MLRSAHRQLKEQAMLAFERFSSRGTDRAEFLPKTLIVAGWTGRDENALHHHIEELAAIGVHRPSSVPVFYRISSANLTQTARLEVLGPDTSGEAEKRWVLRCQSNFAPRWSAKLCGVSMKLADTGTN
jgi:hypothetical protein